MSEGYLCDRCGSTHAGSPDTMLLLGDGRPRYRRGPSRKAEYVHEGELIGDVEFDLCQACRNDLKEWWAKAGGDASDIARE